jgi:hypothetical protein
MIKGYQEISDLVTGEVKKTVRKVSQAMIKEVRELNVNGRLLATTDETSDALSIAD